MEYCSLGSVADIMHLTKRPLIENQIAHVCYRVLNGLNYLLELNTIHRDIKPDNILVTEKGEVKIGDFGVSAIVSSSIGRRNTITGTPYYIAPEILSDEEGGYDAKADIWSVGISALEMAEFVHPYGDIPPVKILVRIMNGEPPQLKDPLSWSDKFRDFIYCCLKKDPKKRPTAKQLLRHPFVRPLHAANNIVLQPLIDEANMRMTAFKKSSRRDIIDQIARLQNEKTPTILSTHVPSNPNKRNIPSDVEWSNTFGTLKKSFLLPSSQIPPPLKNFVYVDETPLEQVSKLEIKEEPDPIIPEIAPNHIFETSKLATSEVCASNSCSPSRTLRQIPPLQNIPIEELKTTIKSKSLLPPPPPPPEGFVGIHKPSEENVQSPPIRTSSFNAPSNSLMNSPQQGSILRKTRSDHNINASYLEMTKSPPPSTSPVPSSISSSSLIFKKEMNIPTIQTKPKEISLAKKSAPKDSVDKIILNNLYSQK